MSPMDVKLAPVSCAFHMALSASHLITENLTPCSSSRSIREVPAKAAAGVKTPPLKIEKQTMPMQGLGELLIYSFRSRGFLVENIIRFGRCLI